MNYIKCLYKFVISIFTTNSKIMTKNEKVEETELDKNKETIITSFENYITIKDPKYIWRDVSEISQISRSASNVVNKVIDTFDEFCQNTKGQYTTRRLYEKNTPFIKKFWDSYRGIIE